MLRLLSQVLTTIGLSYQIYQHKLCQSVYGLSIDYLIFSAFEFLHLIFSLNCYYFSPDQIILRYPIDPPRTSLSFLLFPLINLFVTLCTLYQVNIHKSTLNIDQEISWYCILIISIFELCNLITLLLIKQHWLRLLWLDFAYTLQFQSWILASIKLFPQISLNFSTYSKFGICKTSIYCFLSSGIVSLFANEDFFDGSLVNVSQMVLAGVILFQINCYDNSSPTSPLKNGQMISPYKPFKTV